MKKEKKEEKKKGDKIKVEIKRGNHSVFVEGVVKDVRRNWGTVDYLVIKGKTTDFWTREE